MVREAGPEGKLRGVAFSRGWCDLGCSHPPLWQAGESSLDSCLLLQSLELWEVAVRLAVGLQAVSQDLPGADSVTTDGEWKVRGSSACSCEAQES